MSVISVRNVAKAWGATRAVDDVSFEATAGSLLVLLGPSGCGKSTTLRLIAGLERVSSGRVHIGNIDVTDLPPAKRRISMVFQSYALFPHLSVAENIIFGLKVRGVSAAERAARLARVASLLGLDKLLARKPAQLSGGQQQRVALGRAIIAETPLCLMDEPLSNLDAQLRHDMRREIRSLQQKLGITMVYVTHDQVEAMSMADHVILLRDGHVEQDGRPEDLYNRPASVFSARFIGTPPMNVVALPALTGDGLLLGVRPEDVRIGAEGLAATVQSREFLGADSIVTCRVGDESINARIAGGDARLQPGTPLRLSWSPAAQHLFDARSGKRVEAVTSAAKFVA
ncbi:MAG: ABC transporter ATP-binding protein [Burkholderiales bacterium]